MQYEILIHYSIFSFSIISYYLVLIFKVRNIK